MKRIKPFLSKIKDLTHVGIANVVGTGILSIFWMFLASVLEPDGYGKVSYLLAIANIASVAAFLGAGQTIIVYIAKGLKLHHTIYILSLITGVISATLVFLVQASIEVSIYVIGYIIFNLVIHEVLGAKLYTKYSKFVISQRIMLVILATIFYFSFGINGIILGYGISFLPYSIFLYRGFKGAKIDFSQIKPKVGFMMNNYGRDLSKILSRSLDKLIILPLLSATILGNYQLAFQVLIVLTIIPTIVYQYVLPRQASGLQNKKIKGLAVVASIVISFIVLFAAPIIIPTIFPKYENVLDIIQIMSFAVIPMSITLMYTSKFLALEKSRHVIISAAIFLLVQIFGIIILGDKYGAVGLGVATLLAAISEASYLSIINRVWYYSK